MRKGEKRKQELLGIAYEMFLTKGYEDTSVDEIIDRAQIAKGTYYHYFASKEQMLEEVIGMMISAEAEKAKLILSQPVPAPQKIAGIIAAMKPDASEAPINNTLNRPENVFMHNKIRRSLIATVTPILSEVVEQGINDGIFRCECIPERVKMLLNLSVELFDESDYTQNDIEVFIDITEKMLGAESGTMGFIRSLIR